MKFIFCLPPNYTFVTDKASKSCATNGVMKCLQFPAGALGNQFNASVRQIADEAGDFKAGGDGFRGVAKPDTLHTA